MNDVFQKAVSFDSNQNESDSLSYFAIWFSLYMVNGRGEDGDEDWTTLARVLT